MNPPYKSWDLMEEREREYAISILENKNCKKPNLASIFYYRAAQSLRQNGVLGCLIPTSILHTDSHNAIRETTREIALPSFIGRLGGCVFGHQMVDVSIIIANHHTDTQFMWCDNIADIAPFALSQLRQLNKKEIYEGASCQIYSFPFNKYLAINNNLWMPLPYHDFKYKATLESAVHNRQFKRIKDLFIIKQGARTGANKIFIIKTNTYLTLPENERKYFRPSIDNDAISDGILRPKNYLFFPSNDSFLDEEDLKKKIPEFYWRILSPNKEKLKNRSGIDSSKWWLLTRAREWQRERTPKLVSTEFGNSTKFAFDTKGEYVIERGNCWQLKKEESKDLYYAYLSIFRSRTMNKLLSLYSKQLYGGAYYALSNTNVGMIPLPDFLNAISPLIFEELSSIGKKIVSCKDYDEEELDSLVCKIYEI